MAAVAYGPQNAVLKPQSRLFLSTPTNDKPVDCLNLDCGCLKCND